MRTYDNLPAFCRVYGFVRPVPESKIGFEVWMPMTGWTGRLHMIGGGDYVSNLSYEEMLPRLHDGEEIGRASCRERVCQYGLISVGAGELKKKEQQKENK